MVAMMGWANPEQGWKKGPWTPEEDKLLLEYVNLYGEGRWSSVARGSGLNRSGKSCRLRWVNYLRPGLKKGQLTPQEEGIIIELHALWGNKWSTIARYLPGRTDNEIKNYWRTHFKKKERTSQKQEIRKTQFMKQKWQHQQQLNQVQSTENMQNETQLQEGKQQEMPLMYNPTTMDAHTQPIMSYNDTSWEEHMVEDIGIWGGLWNFLDDEKNHVDFTTTSSRNNVENQVIDFACLGEGSFQ